MSTFQVIYHFSLLAHYTDTILFQIRVYTKAISNENVPPVSHPTIAVQCTIPAFVLVEQEQRRILVQLMCKLVPLPEQRTTRIVVDVTLGIKWPQRLGYRVQAVFPITFSCSNLAPGSISSQWLNAESALQDPGPRYV
jgi:hypothetical protein